MTEYFRITGLNTIPFDSEVTGHADHRYRFELGQAPKGIDKALTKEEAIPLLRNLPTEIASHILGRPGEHVMSVITSPFSIQGADDADMEDAEHDLRETLEDGKLYIRTKGARGTRAVVEMKSDEAIAMSYKTVFWGEFTEEGGRAILGDSIKEHYIRNLQMRLYCEAYWRPEEAVMLGPNEIYCPSFEEDGNADGEADNWDARGASVLSMESTIVLHGCYSQQIDTDAANEGIESTAFAKDAAETDAVAYAWICRPSAGSDIRVIMRDTTNNVDRDTALLSTGGWDEADAKDGVNTFYRLELSSDSLPAGAANYELWIESTAATETTFYVDKCFWLWGTTTAPDEWVDHWLLFNHYDTTEGVAHEGHINYFDVDDLKGDVNARLLMVTEFEQKADNNYARDLIVGRRSDDSPCQFMWWMEAEDASSQSNWADLGGLARCSAGDCVSDNTVATSGYVQWSIQAVYPNHPRWPGRFDVYGAVYTDDPTNSRYRLSSGTNGLDCIEKWVWQTLTSQWELLYLGEATLLPVFLRSGVAYAGGQVQVEYAKDGLDTVRLDFIWLIPKDEPEMRLDSLWVIPVQDRLSVGRTWAICEAEDFSYLGHEDTGTPILYQRRLTRLGQPMSLNPNKENRLYAGCITWDGTGSPPDEEYEAHGAATSLQMIISISYLAQFMSPLE